MSIAPLPRTPNDETNTEMSLLQSQRNFLSDDIARKSSDFVAKDKPPYGVVAALCFIGGTASILVGKIVDGLSSEGKQGCVATGVILLVGAGGLFISAFFRERRDSKIKDAIANSVSEGLSAQMQNNITNSDAYTLASVSKAQEQVSRWKDVSGASMSIDVAGKLPGLAKRYGDAAKTWNDEELSNGLNSLETLNSTSKSLLDSYMRS